MELSVDAERILALHEDDGDVVREFGQVGGLIGEVLIVAGRGNRIQVARLDGRLCLREGAPGGFVQIRPRDAVGRLLICGPAGGGAGTDFGQVFDDVLLSGLDGDEALVQGAAAAAAAWARFAISSAIPAACRACITAAVAAPAAEFASNVAASVWAMASFASVMA